MQNALVFAAAVMLSLTAGRAFWVTLWNPAAMLSGPESP